MKLIPITLIGISMSVALMADSGDFERLKASAEVLHEIMSAPDKAVPADLFRRAYCVVIIPNMLKGGFIFSGKYGRGFASCRKPEGGWTSPAGMRIEGGGFGLQAGGASTDLVLLVMSKRGMRGMLSTKFTLGGEISAAAGPVGRDTTAQTDPSMRADILSWSRSRGIFGGISLQGGTLRSDGDANQAIYGSQISSGAILSGKVHRPLANNPLTPELARYGGMEQGK
jgi:SH3 domain-containing YSC84-like protein 1